MSDSTDDVDFYDGDTESHDILEILSSWLDDLHKRKPFIDGKDDYYRGQWDAIHSVMEEIERIDYE